MIIGIGTDLVDIRRIEKLCARLGKKFEERICAASEIKGRAGSKQRYASLAKRFAAKEACAKALGTGIGKSVKWRDILVSNLNNGAPCLTLSGRAEAHLQKRTPSGMLAQIHLSMTDEYPIAQAFVVISAVSA